MNKLYVILLLVFCWVFPQTNYAQTSNALDFDGVNDHVVVSPTIPYPGTFTLEAWVNFSGTSATIFGWGNSVVNGYVDFSIVNSRIRLAVGSSAAPIDQFDGNTTLSSNTWHHVAVVKNGNAITMYLNGVADGSFSTTNVPAPITSTIIGAGLYNGIVQSFNAKIIDEFRVWNVARTQAEIAANRNCNINPQAGLLAHYRFNQGVVGANNSAINTLIDNSGNNRNGTLTNFTLTGLTSNWVLSGALQPNGNYRSVGSGNFAALGTWEVQVGECWEPATVLPSVTSNNIVIRAGHTVNITTAVSADQIFIDPSGLLNINSGGTLTLSDGPGSDLVVSGTFNLNNAGTLNGGGLVFVNGSGVFNLNAGTIAGSVATEITLAGTLNITGVGGTATLNNNASITNNGGTINWTGSGNINCGAAGSNVSITNNGSFLMNATANFNNTGGGTFFITNTSSGSILRNVSGNTTFTPLVGFANQGSLTNSSATSTITIQSNDFNLTNGSSLVNDGIINITSGADVDITGFTDISGTGTINVNAGLLRVANSTSVSGLETITVFNAGVIEGSGTLQFNNGTTFNWTSGTLRGSGIINTQAGATLNINGAGNVAILQGTRSLNLGGTTNFSTTGNIVFSGPGSIVTINNTGTFNISNTGDFTDLGSGAQLSFNNSGSLIKTNGTTTIPLGASFNNTGSVSVNTGVLNISQAGLNQSGSYTINPGAELTGGTIRFNGSTFTNNGQVSNNEIEFNGNSTQTLAGNGTMQTLRINNPTGMNLTGNQSIFFNLILTNGIINTGSNTLIILPGASYAITSSFSYVNGRMRQHIELGNYSITFPLGNALSQTPINVNFTGVTTAGNLTVGVVDGDHPQIASSGLDGNKSVNRYFSFANNGIVFGSYSTSFVFDPFDYDAIANSEVFTARFWDGSSWLIPASTTSSLNNLDINGITGFFEIAIAEEANPTAGAPFRTVSSGDWFNTSIWEYFDGNAWVASTVAPNETSGTISIENGHAVEITFNSLLIDDLTIQSGGSLSTSFGNLQYSTSDFRPFIQVNGTLNLTNTVVDGFNSPTGVLNISADGVMDVNFVDANNLQIVNEGTINCGGSEIFRISNSLVDNLGILNVGSNLGVIGSGILTNNNLLLVNANIEISSVAGGIINNTNDGEIRIEALPTISANIQNLGNIVVVSGNQLVHNAPSFPLGGIITIENGAQFTSSTSVQMSASTLVNNGEINANPLFFVGVSTALSGSGSIRSAHLTNSTTINLGSNHTITENLDFIGGGRIITGTNTLTVAENASIVGASELGYVQGNLQRFIGVSGPVEFSVGDANRAAFITINPSVDSPGLVTVSTTGTEHPEFGTLGLDPDRSLNRFWSISNQSLLFSVASIDFSWTSADVDINADEASFIAARYNGIAWSFPSTSSAQAGQLSATNVLEFGDFAIAQSSNPIAGSSLNFDGVNDEVEWGGNLVPNNNRPYALSVWVKSNGSANNRTILSQGNNLWLAVNNFGDIQVADNWVTGAQFPNDNNWHNIIIVRNEQTASLYLDGVFVSENDFPLGNPDGNFVLGSSPNNDQFWSGSIDELRIWNKPLCLSEVENFFSCSQVNGYSGLQSYFNFNQGTASGNNSFETTLIDNSGGNLNGTLLNFDLTGSGSNFTADAFPTTGNCQGVETFLYYRDVDGDGFGNFNNTIWLANFCGFFPGYVLISGDCNDNDPTINPANMEVCNGTDDNCDGDIDNNNALNFDGLDDFVEIPEPNIGNGAFTIEFWVNPSDAPLSEMYLVTNRTSEFDNAGNWYRISLTPGRFIEAEFGLAGQASGLFFPSTSQLAIGEWSHVALTRGADNTVRLFINGTQENIIQDLERNFASLDGNVYLGQWAGLAIAPFAGSMDDLRFWGLARTQNDIRASLVADVTGTDGLIRNFTFNQGDAGGDNPSVFLARDLSQGGDGQLFNFALASDIPGSNWVSGFSAPVYADTDGDGFGNVNVSQLVSSACNIPVGFVSDFSDCNDANNAINPNGTEIQNGVDDDCDGSIDEGFSNCSISLTSSTGNTVIICTESGATTANVELVVSNGTPPYTFGAQDSLNLSAGTYQFTVTDALGCVANATIELVQANCIVPYYQPPANDTISNLIGSELTQLATFPESFVDTTVAESIFEIKQQEGEVLIEVISLEGQYNTLLALLQTPAYGLNNIFDNGDSTLIITGFYPIANLKKLDSLPDLINYVRPYYAPIAGNFASTGLTVTQGDKAMGADNAKEGWNVSGNGVKVGVLSDSYNTRAGNPAQLNVVNGDLPGPVNPNYPNPVNVLEEFPFGRATDEGRAMLQIIHDVAPNAELFFRTGFISAGNMAEGIRELRDAGCDVIVDDITYITEPYFIDGVVAQAVEEVSAGGVSYITSAGNFGVKSYEGVFTPTPAPDGYAGVAHDFGGGDIFQSISLEPGTFTLALQWEDGFYSLGQTTGTRNDLDIYLVDQFGNRLFGFNRNNLDGDPLEILPFVVKSDVNANIIVTRKGGNESVRFKYIIFRGQAVINEHNQGSSTIMGHANAASAMSIGAVLYSNTPAFGVNPPTVASFSSRGGLLINGVDRQKPDFCGPNGVNTTVDLGGVNLEGDLFPNFFGTSAAAPHIAGAVALIKEAKQTFQNEVLNGAQMKALIKENIVDMGGDDDYDPATGAGFVKVTKVLSEFSNPQPTLESLQLADPGAAPGEEAVEVIINGEYFDENASVIFQYDTLQAQFMNDSTLMVQIPPFAGNPPLTVWNPAITNSGLDGGLSDSLYFFGTVPQNVTVRVNDAVKRYGEQIPPYEVEITLNGTPLAAAGLSAADLGLDDLSFSSSANAFSNVGLYFRRASSSVTNLSLPESQALAELYNYQFIDGVLSIERMPLTVIPKDTTLEYGAPIDGRDIKFNYIYDTQNIAAADQPVLLDSLIAAHQFNMSQTIVVVDGKAVVGGRTLTEQDLNALSFFASGNVEANTISSGRGKRIVNGVEFDTLRYVSLAPEAIFALQEDEINLTVFNALSAGRGKRIVNTLTAGRGKRIVNGESFINGTPLVNGVSSGRGKRIVNSNTFNDLSNETAILILDSLDAVNSENNDSISGYVSMNLITGVDVGEWFIAPGVLISENFDISYSLGKLTITPMELFVRAENKTKTCSDDSIEFTTVKEFYQYEDTDSVVVASGPDFTLLNSSGEPVNPDNLTPGTYQIVPSNLVQLGTTPNYIPVYENGTLTVEPGVVAAANAGTITCFGGSTTVVVTATGGTEPYTGVGTFTASAGPYSYTVTDANGCSSTVSGTVSQPAALPPAPTGLACWQIPVFNQETCTWDITGTQPEEPTNLACWQIPNFNTSTCAWEVSGTQPPAPTNLACWQMPNFNTSTCAWEVIGTQPEEPTNLACWQIPNFNTNTCAWEISGTQPAAPTNLACWQMPNFNTSTCAWEVSGVEPIEPVVYADAVPQTTSTPYVGPTVVESRARWGATGFEAVLFTPAHPGPPPAGVGLSLNPVGTPIWLDGFTRNFQFIYDASTGASTWSIDWNNNQVYGNGETVTSTASGLVNKGFENLNIFLQGGAVDAPNTGASVTVSNFNLNGVDFGGFMANNNTVVTQSFRNSEGLFGNITITGRVNFANGAGTANERPRFYIRFGNAVEIENQNCWDNVVLNNTTCTWENIGTQPPAPTNLACWQNPSFNTNTCTWDVTGTQPPMPALLCYQTAQFNNTTCSWVISGSPNPPVVSNISACGSYLWPVNGQTYTQAGTYQVEQACTTFVLNLTILAAPTVGNISGPTNSCAHQGSNGTLATYSIQATNASTYQWTIPSGATNISGQGSPSISFRFPSSFSSGTVSVVVGGCGAPVQRSIQVIRTAPTTPGSISGPSNVCAFRGNGTQATYTIAPVANASSYSWTLPSGVSMVSGAGTNSISVTIAANFSSGTLKVRANSPCGNSSDRSLSLNTSTPSTPGSITGPSKACPGDVRNYSVNTVTNATGYNWTIPTGTSIVAGAGTNAISLSFGANYTGGTLSVRATNGCGQSNSRSLSLSRNTPSTPASISGPASNLCGGGTFTYTIQPVSNATTYNWTLPSGATMVTNNGTSVTISLASNFSSGNITVAAVNGCGTSTARSLSLSRMPATPASITGPTTVCRNQQGVVYSTPAIAGLSYSWTVPSGATITSGQGTASITVKFGTSNGCVTVRASNACGNSNTRSINICTVACRMDGENPEVDAIAETEISGEQKLILFPNPGNGQFSLSGLIPSEPAFVQIFASNGQVVESLRVPAESMQLRLDISKFASGLYLIRIEQAGKTEELRYVKE